MAEKSTTSPVAVGLSWAFVGIPLAAGVVATLLEASALFL